MRYKISLADDACTGFGLLLPVVLCALLFSAQSASAQCVRNFTGETAVGLKNASSLFLTLYIDTINKGSVPSGDRSIDFLVAPGPHTLRAEGYINGEVISTSRAVIIAPGFVCTWTVTDPLSNPTQARTVFRDALEFRRLTATVPLVVPNF
jgi:hypothetical protein